jgi:hypothetical protein
MRRKGKILRSKYPTITLKMVKRSREDFDLLPPDEFEDSSAASLPSIRRSTSQGTSTQGPVKLIHIDRESGEASQESEVMRCSLPPHRQTISFSTFEEYEIHYNKCHVNRCSECRKNFPTSYFLDLHISENHNPLVGVLKDRGERTVSTISSKLNYLGSTS